ncbi:MAG: hypothetical protein AAGJ40_00160 [Planctomycetota bacterium]
MQSIPIDDDVASLPVAPESIQLIDTANEAIESFLSHSDETFENFVPCDFHLLDQTLSWIGQRQLAAGNRFCEWGAGFGVVAMLAAIHGMESTAIELEPSLWEQSMILAQRLGSPAEFVCGSFIPRELSDLERWGSQVNNVDSSAGDTYDEMDQQIEDFDLIFAFPWPGEADFFEMIFRERASSGAMLLTYHGREGVRLLRRL